MKEFWKLKTNRTVDKTETHLLNNYRPIQPLNDREVYDCELHYRFGKTNMIIQL